MKKLIETLKNIWKIEDLRQRILSFLVSILRCWTNCSHRLLVV